ncbi:MAG: response regulator [Burkholderiaceae bacterium]|jgi:two-component system chemotaxis response regulator CheY|nr:response regulator [Burkholderiaceae bacterium]
MTTHDTPPAPARAADRPRRILVADDVGDSRVLLVRLLRQFTAAEIHEARDGSRALERFRRLRPDITLLDVDMPERDGMSVLNEIRRDGDTEAFVAMVTARSEAGLVHDAVAQGVGSFVVKPYSARRVLDMLQRYVAKTGDTGMLAR